ncbi:uncharacterized protein BO95DRAFT_429096 [Aspergillus brunneoviolaceus CBS 621.78]|uniref:Uncharacterized protein n=1 Tax=Aspergillus brunneoviolaceus CBS 621.78 TaxID=1450534 RepID=A0ACD1GHZ3_9EURO|nr:hypothetical protein BO95DRAFT_429096 [Aspergillus brunneoviolaceus CBS 621.78]RAH48881.1 hypothetical protein BO95DRAFT_429096 [Aspergillus brunneoviolaceus CBS 621.78]
MPLRVFRDISHRWALVSRLDHAPESLIRVGNILVNPSEPHRPLTRVPASEGQEGFPPIITETSVGHLTGHSAWKFNDTFEPGVEIPPEARSHDGLLLWDTKLSIGDHHYNLFYPKEPREEVVQASLMRDPTIQALLEQRSGGDCKLYLVNCLLIVENISIEGRRYHFPEGRPEDGVNVIIKDQGPKILAYRMLEVVIDPARRIKLNDYSPAREDPHFFPDSWSDVAHRLLHQEIGAEYMSEQEGEVTVGRISLPEGQI